MFENAEDHEEIRQLIARYCHHVDKHEASEWAALFSEDGILDAGVMKTQGTEALRDFVEGMRSNPQIPPMRHIVTNVVIDVQGDEATSQSYILVLRPGEVTQIGLTARYDDRLRRIDGHWRFVERRIIPDLSAS